MDFYDVVFDWFAQSNFSWANYKLLVQLLDEHAKPLLIGVIGAIIGIICYIMTQRAEAWWKGRKMSAFARKMRDGKRKTLLLEYLADIIGDGLDDYEHVSKISKTERKWLLWYTRQQLKLPDLMPGMPRKVWNDLLKRYIKEDQKRREINRKAGLYGPSPIPDEKGNHWVGKYTEPKLDDFFVQKAAA
jgi:hypothetical protein